MKISIGSDHGGYALKQELITYLQEKGHEVKDSGCHDTSSCDYPEMASRVATAIQRGEAELGLLFCGTGLGISMAANKYDGIRAACCSDYFSAKFTRVHNDANILCLGERVTGRGLAADLADIFLNTDFEGGRHLRRIELFDKKEA